MTRIQTLSHPNKRTSFEYTGNVRTGVELLLKSPVSVPPELFSAAMEHFRGRTVVGGFSMTDPPSDGFGAWLRDNSKRLVGRQILTPRHGSFLAAILVHETHVVSSRRGNAILLSF